MMFLYIHGSESCFAVRQSRYWKSCCTGRVVVLNRLTREERGLKPVYLPTLKRSVCQQKSIGEACYIRVSRKEMAFLLPPEGGRLHAAILR